MLSRFVCTLLCVVAVYTLSVAQAESAEQVLQLLKRFDKGALGEASITATMVEPRRVDETDSEEWAFTYRYTSNDSEQVSQKAIDETIPDPQYVEPKGDPTPLLAGKPDDFDIEGVIFVARPKISQILRTDQEYKLREVRTTYVLRPPNELVSKEETDNVIVLYSREKRETDTAFSFPLLGTGRGFSPYLDEFLSITNSEPNMLICEADGTYPNPVPFPCKWRITVDVDNDYLVREAVATSVSGVPLTRFRTEGVFASGGNIIARKCTIDDDRSSQSQKDSPFQIVYEQYEDRADLELLAMVKVEFDPPYVDGTTVSDHRGENHQVTRVESLENTRLDRQLLYEYESQLEERQVKKFGQ
jgi:hypothetical protein